MSNVTYRLILHLKITLFFLENHKICHALYFSEKVALLVDGVICNCNELLFPECNKLLFLKVTSIYICITSYFFKVTTPTLEW